MSVWSHFREPAKKKYCIFLKKVTEKIWWNQKNVVPLQPQIRNDADAKYEYLKRGVAQPGSAPVLGTGGRRFESCRPDLKIHRKNSKVDVSGV